MTDRRSFLSWIAECFAAGSMLGRHWRGFTAEPEQLDDVSPIKATTDDLPRFVVCYPCEKRANPNQDNYQTARDLISECNRIEAWMPDRGLVFGQITCNMLGEGWAISRH